MSTPENRTYWSKEAWFLLNSEVFKILSDSYQLQKENNQNLLTIYCDQEHSLHNKK